MNRLKRFRTLVLIGLTLMGVIVFSVWLSFIATRQQQLDADLLTALTLRQIPEVKSLLQEGADPNTRDLSGIKSESLLQQLIALITWQHGAEYNQSPTALCYAADQGIRGDDPTVNPVLVKLLLDYGANVQVAEKCDRPPLLCAASWGDIPMVQLLLEHGANANQPAHYPFDSALHAAIMGSDTEMLRLLLEHGAHIQVQKDNTGRDDLDWAHDAKSRNSAYGAAYSVQAVQIIAMLEKEIKSK